MNYYLDINVQSDPVEQVLMKLDTAISPTGLMGFLAGAAVPWVRERAQSRFASEGDDVSGKWRPLAPATQEIRSRGEWPVGATSPINVRTTELERYITQSNAAVWEHTLGATMKYPGTTPTRRSIVEKMRTAQKGRANPRTPARPVLGLNEKDLSAITGFLVIHVNEAMR